MIPLKLATVVLFLSLGMGVFAWAAQSTGAQSPYRLYFPVSGRDSTSPTPTPSPSPTPGPPVTIDSPLELVSFRDLVAANGSRVYLGEVKNKGIERTGVSIRYGYFRGTTIVQSGGAVILPPSTSIAAGAKAPFQFYAPTEAWDRWELAIKPAFASRTTDDPLLSAVDVQVEEKWGAFYVKGEIRNVGSSAAKSVRVGVTGYDAEGQIVAVDYGLAASSDIPEGMGALFNVAVATGRPQDIVTYQLRLVSFRD
ncbi:MAG: hypothetical protein HYX92_13765 [Chloroflexi bacterium]|nr:hypothetical protein [Chloroflexota bacterium]